MRLHTNDPGMRIVGTLTGVGFLLIGLYAVFGHDDGSVAAAMRARALVRRRDTRCRRLGDRGVVAGAGPLGRLVPPAGATSMSRASP